MNYKTCLFWGFGSLVGFILSAVFVERYEFKAIIFTLIGIAILSFLFLGVQWLTDKAAKNTSGNRGQTK